MGGGFQRLTRLYGAIVLNGQRYVWDYANEVGVREQEMPFGSERHAASERAKVELLRKQAADDAVNSEGSSRT